jgi:hypothetical protein
MLMISEMLVTTGFIICSAVVDSEHLKKGEYIKSHTSRSVLRALFFISIGIHNPLHGIASALFFAALFDQMLNTLMDKDLFYLGAVAKWDIFFRKRKTLYISIKIICLVLSWILFVN